MESVIRALQVNDTWSVVDLIADKYIVGSKWIYKVKHIELKVLWRGLKLTW